MTLSLMLTRHRDSRQNCYCTVLRPIYYYYCIYCIIVVMSITLNYHWLKAGEVAGNRNNIRYRPTRSVSIVSKVMHHGSVTIDGPLLCPFDDK